VCRLRIPQIASEDREICDVIAVEGCNGAGKTTLVSKFRENHSEYDCGLCVPEVFQTATDMKHFMLFESSVLCSALYYLSGAVESKYQHSQHRKKILYDRSVWSTFAAAYSKDPSVIPSLLACLKAIKEYIHIPTRIFVLEASYEICKIRTMKKTEGGEFDRDSKIEFERKTEFYHLLKDSGYDVVFIDTNECSPEEVYCLFCAELGV
jgi:hypothetical protein